MSWNKAEKYLEMLASFLYEAHAHTAQLTQAVIAANSRNGPPALSQIILPFAQPASLGGDARPVAQHVSADFLSNSRRGKVPGWVIALTNHRNLLARIRAGEG